MDKGLGSSREFDAPLAHVAESFAQPRRGLLHEAFAGGCSQKLTDSDGSGNFGILFANVSQGGPLDPLSLGDEVALLNFLLGSEHGSGEAVGNNLAATRKALTCVLRSRACGARGGHTLELDALQRVVVSVAVFP